MEKLAAEIRERHQTKHLVCDVVQRFIEGSTHFRIVLAPALGPFFADIQLVAVFNSPIALKNLLPVSVVQEQGFGARCATHN